MTSAADRDPLVVAAWDDVAARYLEVWVPRFRPFVEDALAALAPAPGPIAVPGCGPGDEVLSLARRFPGRPIVATDPSRPMLALLRARVPDGAPIAALEGSAEELPSQVRGAGAVLSCFALQLLADPAAALGAWARALGPGGTITCLFWPPRQAPGSPWDRLRLAVERVTGQTRPDWEPALRGALPRLGLELAADRTVTHPFVHESPDAAWRELVEAGPLRMLVRRAGEDVAGACGRAWLADHGLRPTPGGWVQEATARLWVLAPRGGAGAACGPGRGPSGPGEEGRP